MAESTSFPQIPSTVWAGVWKLLHDSPNRKLDENVLAIELGVQKTAARQYLNELTRLGLFSDGATTDLAKEWRQNGDDPQIIQKILEFAYPEELRDLAPPDRLDRDKIERWFLAQGLGAGASRNKAATYVRVASGVSSVEAPKATKRTSERTKVTKPTRTSSSPASEPDLAQKEVPAAKTVRQTKPELNINIQIHISADSTKDQIDAIFSAMKRYFDGSTAN